MAGFSHLQQQMEYGLANAGSFLFSHGNPGDAAASLEASSVVLDTRPVATASPEKKRKPREDTSSLNSAHSPKVRRERISERMRMLQALVPGCDKVTGKALILDEIINYVQSLQNQVEFLSMRIASLSPVLYGFGMESDAAFSDQSQIEGMFLGAAALPTDPPMTISSSPAPSQAMMDTGTSSSSPPYSLHGTQDPIPKHCRMYTPLS
ncbi:hypothetical protein ACQ4PT_071962 [Festuca glaucescens]